MISEKDSGHTVDNILEGIFSDVTQFYSSEHLYTFLLLFSMLINRLSPAGKITFKQRSIDIPSDLTKSGRSEPRGMAGRGHVLVPLCVGLFMFIGSL